MPVATGKTKVRAPRNRTIEVGEDEVERLRPTILDGRKLNDCRTLQDRIIRGDAFEVLKHLPNARFDLLFADPPYNLRKEFGSETFRERSDAEYRIFLDSWLSLAAPLLKATGSVYICGDWRSAAAVQTVGSRYFKLRNRITWEREKGRGARANWKNTAEDIWFFTVSDDFTFNIDAVKQRRRVMAPYRENGRPKDWNENGTYRDTHPSNIWTDISVPFWSMPENTDHPTQKPEKLLAKILLASTNKADAVLDPFGGSGTTAVVARKLDRSFIVIEKDKDHCLLASKRLEMAETDRSIQGFGDGVFWERNSSKR